MDLKAKLETLRKGIIAGKDNSNIDPELLLLLDVAEEIVENKAEIKALDSYEDFGVKEGGYLVGDIVRYKGLLYRFIEDFDGEVWNPSVVESVTLSELLDRNDEIGDLSELETDHKSDLVSAINELFEVLETSELVVSMEQSTADRKVIYDLVVAHPQIAKEIVFYNSADQLYYRVNGYNMVNDILTLHVIMKDGALMDKQVQIGSNGSIAII